MATNPYVGTFLYNKNLEVLVAGRYRVRCMKNACGARHWGLSHMATSQEILRVDLDLVLFIGPVKRIRPKKERLYLMPCSCMAGDKHEAVPGEILDAGDLSDSEFLISEPRLKLTSRKQFMVSPS